MNALRDKEAALKPEIERERIEFGCWFRRYKNTATYF